MGRELAEQYPTGRFQPLRDHRVPAGDVALQDLGMRRGRKTLDVDDVLQRIGHAMERPAPSPGRYLGLGRSRRSQCPFRRQCNEGVVVGVVVLDAGQQRGHILDRGQFLRADQISGFSESEIGELAAHGVSPFAR